MQFHVFCCRYKIFLLELQKKINNIFLVDSNKISIGPYLNEKLGWANQIFVDSTKHFSGCENVFTDIFLHFLINISERDETLVVSPTGQCLINYKFKSIQRLLKKKKICFHFIKKETKSRYEKTSMAVTTSITSFFDLKS